MEWNGWFSCALSSDDDFGGLYGFSVGFDAENFAIAFPGDVHDFGLVGCSGGILVQGPGLRVALAQMKLKVFAAREQGFHLAPLVAPQRFVVGTVDVIEVPAVVVLQCQEIGGAVEDAVAGAQV